MVEKTREEKNLSHDSIDNEVGFIQANPCTYLRKIEVLIGESAVNSKIVDVSEVQTHFTQLLSLVQQGTEVVISQEHRPMARLMPLVLPTQLPPRIAGLHAGAGWVSDDFDEPLEF